MQTVGPVTNIARTRSAFGAILLAAFCLFTVAHQFIAADWPILVALGLLTIYLVLDLSTTKPSAWGMILGMVAAAIASLMVFGLHRDVWLPAFERGAFIAFFVISLTTLRIPCQRSDLILRLGTSIVSQPENRRYLSLALGAQLFGVLLSIGAISLLGTAARQSVTPGPGGGDNPADQHRLRQMTLAILRGFAPLAIWSPTSVTLIVVLDTFVDVTWLSFLPYAVAATVAFIALGWLFDRAAQTTESPAKPTEQASGQTRRLLIVVLRTMPIILGIAVIAWALTWLLSVSTILALTISVPICSTLWLLAQNLSGGEARALAVTGDIIQREFSQLSEQLRPEVGIFLAAGVMSILIGPLFSIDGLFEHILSAGLPQPIFLICVCFVILALSAVGISPFLSVMLIASTLVQLEEFTIASHVTVLALMMTWSASVSISSFMAVTRILAICVHLPVNVICLRWNLKFAMVWMGFVATWVLVATL